MYKQVINNEDLKKKQSEVCALISQIWDAESLDIILGSVQNIIRIKKLVMMVDASCGSTQIYTQPPIHDQIEGEEEEDQSEGEESDIDDIRLSDSDIGEQSDTGDHVLVYSSPPFDKLAAPTSQPMMNEEGEYITQIICQTLAPPRITIVEEPEEEKTDEWESLFGNIDDITFDTDEEDEQKQEQQQEQQHKQEDNNDDEERQRVVADYIATPIEQINAQCPYFLTREEAANLFDTDFSPINEVVNVPEVITGRRPPSPQTQSNNFI